MMVDDNGAERFTLRIRDLATGERHRDRRARWRWAGRSGRRVGRGASSPRPTSSWRTYRARLHRLGDDRAERRDALRGDRRRRLPRRRRAIVGPQPDLPRHRRHGDQRELRFVAGRRSDRAAGAGGARGATGVATASTARTDGSGSSTNDDHENFRLAVADPATPGRLGDGDRRARTAVYLLGVELLPRPLVIEERAATGSTRCGCAATTASEHRIAFPEASYTAGLGRQPASSRRRPTGSATPRWSRPATVVRLPPGRRGGSSVLQGAGDPLGLRPGRSTRPSG